MYNLAADLDQDFFLEVGVSYNVRGTAYHLPLLPHIYTTLDHDCGTEVICDFLSGCKHTLKVLFTCIINDE